MMTAGLRYDDGERHLVTENGNEESRREQDGRHARMRFRSNYFVVFGINKPIFVRNTPSSRLINLASHFVTRYLITVLVNELTVFLSLQKHSFLLTAKIQFRKHVK